MSENADNPRPPPSPISNGAQTDGGRGPRGRFRVGNHGGPGNPLANKVAQERQKFLAAIRSNDVKKCLETLRQIRDNVEARPSDRITAAVELLNRIVGKVVEAETMQRLEALEALLSERTNNGGH